MAQQRKLNKGQLRRVRQNQQRRLDTPSVEEEITNDDLAASEHGVIISRFGQHADVQGDDGYRTRCHIRRGVESLVCGDSVVWRRAKSPIAEQSVQGIVEAVHPRKSLLSRPDFYDGLKPVAANIDQIFIISSVLPAFSAQIIDRYLVACEDSEITPVIVLNKADLMAELEPEQQAEITTTLAMYEDIGYRVMKVSAHTKTGMDELTAALSERVSVVVGQSGVGKSSLVNSLLPEIEADIGAISDNSGLGQHTTTVATWYDLAQSNIGLTGALIDSPGIREFALWHLEPDRVAWCYRDFRPFLGQCKFRDCKHQDDPGCALQEAVNSGDLHALRLYNFHRIVESMQTQKPPRMTNKGSAQRGK